MSYSQPRNDRRLTGVNEKEGPLDIWGPKRSPMSRMPKNDLRNSNSNNNSENSTDINGVSKSVVTDSIL